MKPFDRRRLEQGAFNIRKHIIETIVTNGEGHAGGAMSAADLLAVLYLSILELEGGPQRRDKFLLSGGHKCLALYGALVESGFLSEEELKTYNRLHTRLVSHPVAGAIGEIDFSTGSLGHGLPLGCGYAKSAKIQKNPYKTYVLMGDGEQGEGANWEAAAFAAFNGLDNLIAIIDENGLQINGRTCEICKPSSFEERYRAFGWSVRGIDGHDVEQIYKALHAAPFEQGKPSLIVAKTIKGKGLSFMEGALEYHHWNPKPEQAKLALEELNRLSCEKEVTV